MANANEALFREITDHKLFSYKVKMAMILFNRQDAYEVLKEDAAKSMLREGQPSAICERVFKGLYETKAWYIPDRLKFWDKRFGQLFERPFFAFDEDQDTWSRILKFYSRCTTPRKDEYTSRNMYNKDWGFFAEILAVSKYNAHPLFEESYKVLKERGLPDKVFDKKLDELSKSYQ